MRISLVKQAGILFSTFILSIIIILLTKNDTTPLLNTPETHPTEAREPVGNISFIERLTMPTPLYIQGLEIINDKLLIGTGEYGKSELGYIEKDEYNTISKLPDTFFGEGITSTSEHIYQLTWKKGVLLQRDINTGDVLNTFTYHGQGWGLAYDGEHLIRSDGSRTLYYHTLDNFNITKTLHVQQDNLNELEYANGYIYANVWHSNNIIKIDPTSGDILETYDLSSIEEKPHADGVLNGIAHIKNNLFYVTGKDWQYYYIVELR